jgi:hypothetical protein
MKRRSLNSLRKLTRTTNGGEDILKILANSKDRSPEDVIAEILENDLLLAEAVADGKLRLSTQGGDLYFHQTPQALLEGERSRAEFLRIMGVPRADNGFNLDLPDDAPQNQAWAKKAYGRQEQSIRELKTEQRTEGKSVPSSVLNPRIVKAQLAL